MLIASHKIAVIFMFIARVFRLRGDQGGQICINESAAHCGPELLPDAGGNFVVFYQFHFFAFRNAEQFLPHLIRMLIEEAVQNDSVGLVKSSIQPLFMPVLRWGVFLTNQVSF